MRSNLLKKIWIVAGLLIPLLAVYLFLISPAMKSVVKDENLYNLYTYKGFSIQYPSSWALLDISVNPEFPVKDRLLPLFDKSIALNKGDLYLVITINPESDGSIGGIFFNEEDFLKNSETVTIIDNNYFFTPVPIRVDGLAESHSGPGMWTCLAEYIPNKVTDSGAVYKGYENLIKKNGYEYLFMLITESSEGETLDAATKEELVTILESIKW